MFFMIFSVLGFRPFEGQIGTIYVQSWLLYKSLFFFQSFGSFVSIYDVALLLTLKTKLIVLMSLFLSVVLNRRFLKTVYFADAL